MKKVAVSEIEYMLVIEHEPHEDARGVFQQLYLSTSMDDFYPIQIGYSVSNKNVIRGLHMSPYQRLITCLAGCSYNVVVDLREESETYKNWFGIWLSDPSTSILVPERCAHGFFSDEKNTTLLFINDDEWTVEKDTLVNWKSFPVEWPEAPKYTMSQKDRNAPKWTL